MERQIALPELARTLAAEIQEGIAKGALSSGTRLKPVRELAKEHGVSYVTMQRALKQLESKGVVDVRRGSGVYVRGEGQPDAGGASTNRRIAAVLPAWLDTHGHEEVMRIVLGLLKTAAPHRWRVETVYAPPSSHTSLHFLEEVLWRKPDGVAWLRPTPPQVVHLARLAERAIPICACGRHFSGAPYPSFSYDLEDLGIQILRWAQAHGRLPVTILGVVADPYADPTPGNVFAAFECAAQKISLDSSHLRLLALPRSLAAPVHAHARQVIRDAQLGGTVVSPYQDLLVHFARLSEEGLWEKSKRPALIDLNQHYIERWPEEVSRFPFYQAEYAFEEEGAALARFFEWKWAGGPEPAATPFRARLRPLAEDPHVFHMRPAPAS